MYGEIADSKHDDDNDQHLCRFPPGTQLQFDRSVGIDGEHIFAAVGTTGTIAAATSVVTVMVVMIAARLLREETHCGNALTEKDKSTIMFSSFPF